MLSSIIKNLKLETQKKLMGRKIIVFLYKRKTIQINAHIIKAIMKMEKMSLKMNSSLKNEIFSLFKIHSKFQASKKQHLLISDENLFLNGKNFNL